MYNMETLAVILFIYIDNTIVWAERMCSASSAGEIYVNNLLANAIDFGKDIKLLRDPTRGGVATVLNEIARSCKVSIELNEKSFPIDRQVRAACEMLGLDPLYVANEGIFLAVVKSEVAESVISALNNYEFGKEASIIGLIHAKNPGKVFIKSSIGGRRVVGMMAGEQLPRIC